MKSISSSVVVAGALACLLTGSVAPAAADTIANFALDDVTFDLGSGTASGGFTLDLTTYAITNVNITTPTYGILGTTYDDGVYLMDGNGNFTFFRDADTGDSGYTLAISTPFILNAANLVDSPFSIPGGLEGYFDLSTCGPFFPCVARDVNSGSLVVTSVTTTPIPAALSLFATGLGGLGLVGWRKKRKAQAVAA